MMNFPGYDILEHLDETPDHLIFRARIAASTETAIIKLLKVSDPPSPEIARFRHEYALIQNADIDGVARILDIMVVSDDGMGVRLAVAEEDLPGRPVKEITRAALPSRLSADTCMDMAIRIARIIENIHAHNLSHRSITTGNVYYDALSDILKITGFGIAGELTGSAKRIYDPWIIANALPYISPEQTGRINRDIDYRTDLYSLGVVLYEMATGRPPFSDSDPMDIVYSHIARPPGPIEDVSPEIPPCFAAIIRKLLAKNPEDRYQTGFGLVSDLGKCRERMQRGEENIPFSLGEQDICLTFHVPRILVGRRRETGELADAFAQMSASGKTAVIFISGEAGIGKSALASEFEKTVITRQGFFLAGKYGQIGRQVPYSAIIQAFGSLAEQILAQSAKEIALWKEKIGAAMGASGKIITDMIPRMETVMGVQPALPELGAEEAKNLFNDALKRFINAFSGPKHPVVLFLDDLQKADPASLDLIEKLAGDDDLHYFLLLGAWRDGKTETNPLLRKTISALTASGVSFRNITLSPLDANEVGRLLAALLHCRQDICAPLAAVIHNKTLGNPFFVNQFIRTLYEEKYLEMDSSGSWQFDVDAITGLQVTDNVVDFMTRKLEKLPPDALAMLGTAACIGNRFDAETLAAAAGIPIGDVLRVMEGLMQEGFLIYRQGDYGFGHDRIYEAAYFLLDPATRSDRHYRIGRRMLEKTPEEQLSNQIFYIADQLNLGRGGATDPDEARQLARLNLQAGIKAKDTAAFSAAVNYLDAGIEMLPEDAWTADYDLAYSLYSQQMECRYIDRDFDEAERLFNIITANAADSTDKVKAATLMIVQHTNKRSFGEALDLGVKALGLFDIRISADIGRLPVLLELIKARWRIGKTDIHEIPNMARTNHPRRIAENNLLLAMATPAYYVNRNLFAFIVLKVANELLQNGPSMHSEISVMGLAAILQNILGEYDRGFRMGEMALAMNRKSNNRSIAGQVHHSFAFFIQHWKRHARHDIEIYRKVYEQSLAAGNLIFAGHSVNAAADCRLLIGDPLDEILEESRKHEKLMDHVKDPFIAARFRENIQMARCLMGRTRDPLSLDGNGFNEKSYSELLHRETNIFGLCYSLLYKVILFYLHGRYEKALEAARDLDRHIDAPIGTLMVPAHYFYYSLALAAVAREKTGIKKQALLAKIRKHQRKMKRWAELCPDNFGHKHALVEAEMAAARASAKGGGDFCRTLQLYHEAVNGARQHAYVNEEALACERIAQFYLDMDACEEAGMYLKKAHQRYGDWKAHALQVSLESRHPRFFSLRPQDERTPKGAVDAGPDRTADGLLDIDTVMKMSRTISSEIVLDRLLEKIMALSITNAGAQKGFLILEADEKRVVAAGTDPDQNIRRIEKPVPLEDCGELSAGIVNYVFQSKEPVILADASAQGPFKNDAHVMKNACKSVLCMPILNKGSINGVLYMENNLSTSAFTQKRLEILNIIAGQAAISLENARLFEMATTDGLTRLFVHRYFHMLLEQELERSRRYVHPCSLLMIDIDDFKHFNDTYGHLLGDEVLKKIAATLLENTRAADITARYGGEEFVVILTETGANEAKAAAEKIREAIEKVMIRHDSHVLSITASIGSATFPDHTADKTELIRMADEALYLSKKTGKNRVSTWTEESIPAANESV